MKLSYQKRISLTGNYLNKRLFQLMEDKKSNLIFAADISETKKLLDLVEKVGRYICILKTHIDILDNFDLSIVEKLKKMAKKDNFLIFEDRKFADIGKTVKKQYSGGIYKIVEWADFINCHPIAGPGIIKALREVVQEKGLKRGLILLAQMSSENNLITDDYTRKVVAMAKDYPDFVSGFIGNGGNPAELKKLSQQVGQEFIIMTPGVNLEIKGDDLGQKYSKPQDVIKAGADCIIVGQGIYQADNPETKAKEYQKKAWQFYLEAIEKP